MIGLVDIAKVFNMQYKEIGESIGVSAQTIQDWVKERRRIPSKRLKQLSDLFTLREEYFSKELSELEIMEVQMQYLHSLATKVEMPLFDEEGKQIGYKNENDNQSELNYMEQQKDRIQKKERIMNELEELMKSDEFTEEEAIDFNSSNIDVFASIIKVMNNKDLSDKFKVIIYLLKQNVEGFGEVSLELIDKKYIDFAKEINRTIENYKEY